MNLECPACKELRNELEEIKRALAGARILRPHDGERHHATSCFCSDCRKWRAKQFGISG